MRRAGVVVDCKIYRYGAAMSDMPLFDRPDAEHEPTKEEARVYRVAEINRVVRLTLEDRWADVWVEGELSDVHRSAAGHVYFTLNDELDPAQLRGVVFRSDALRATAQLENGHRVRLRGGLSLFESRGQFQMIARLVRPAGEGDLAARFEKIRRALAAEGLLDEGRKRALPRFPQTVGVVTSVQGAALHDIVRVAAGRCPVRLVVADCRVQGEEAAASIVRALELIQRLPDLDAVIIARGGGSAEDLWSFNHEAVARAIATCRVPTVSGVGHETDITIADLIADVRASTPSNAAELLVPQKSALLRELEGAQRDAIRALEAKLDRSRLRLEKLERALTDPRHALSGVRRRLDALNHGLVQTPHRQLAARRAALTRLRDRLVSQDPRVLLAEDRRLLGELRARLNDAGRRPVAHAQRQFAAAAASLQALSPLRVLERGYAIALHADSHQAIRDVAEVSSGDSVEVRVAKGSFRARVEDDA